MNHNRMLSIASLISLVLLTLHLTDDVVRGMFPPGIAILAAAIISGALLYAMLMLAERRSGQVVMLVVSLIAVSMPYLHTKGAGVVGIAKSSGGLFFIWTLVALGAIGTFTFLLSVRALRSPREAKIQTGRVE